MGLGAALLPSGLVSCSTDDGSSDLPSTFDGEVLIIGAGAAGLMAAYHLRRRNISFQILEASSVFGGRVKKVDNFADFPIDLGAEWVHDNPDIFSKLIDNEEAEGSIELIPYNPETMYYWLGGRLVKRNWQNPFYGEHKFTKSTWYDFFDQYIVPDFSDKIVYNSPVTEIDYSADRIKVRNASNEVYEADRVIVTVPTTILKSGSISFIPELPQEKVSALDEMYVPEGIKVFLEFSERFYPDILLVSDDAKHFSDQKIFYNAAFKKESSKNILGLFNVGPSASRYTNLLGGLDIVATILEELDTMFDGKASKYYLNHEVQNWTAEPYIRGSYTHFNGAEEEVMNAVRSPLENKVFFAGEALSTYSSATVHGAGLSGKTAVDSVLNSGG